MTTVILGILGPILGLLGVALGIRFTQKNWRQGQVSERYNKAVDQIASDRIDIRIAGILALGQVVNESVREQSIVFGVLTAFVRENSQGQRLQVSGDRRLIGEDVEAAVTIIARAGGKYGKGEIDLRNTYLSAIKIPGADLPLADLTNAELKDADLIGADMPAARLMDANLCNANLSSANLREANFIRACLANARLDGACFIGAHLTGADITGAKLMKADFSNAYLIGATLINANLTSANFSNADLSSANLSGASIDNANFMNANLTRAIFPDAVALPEGWSRDSGTDYLVRNA